MEHDKPVNAPEGFLEAVRAALQHRAAGDLRLLEFEAASFAWKHDGRRRVAQAQAHLTPGGAHQNAVACEPPSRAVLFSGHMVDTADKPKEKARFPRTLQAEAKAREMIRQAVDGELHGHAASLLGIAGAACGGDILFHEVCAELRVKTEVYLLMPQEAFELSSVQHGGPGWVGRYRSLLLRCAPRVLQQSAELPRWLVDKPDYNAWERNNLWMMFNAMATRAHGLSVVALYNREREADGPGGTGHLVAEAAKRGFRPVELDARELLTVSGKGADEA